jgi:hypothetical protein
MGNQQSLPACPNGTHNYTNKQLHDVMAYSAAVGIVPIEYARGLWKQKCEDMHVRDSDNTDRVNKILKDNLASALLLPNRKRADKSKSTETSSATAANRGMSECSECGCGDSKTGRISIKSTD